MNDFIPFSKRYGYINPEEILKRNYENISDELRIRLWNLIFRFLEKTEEKNKNIWKDLVLTIWSRIFYKEIDKLPIIYDYYKYKLSYEFKKEFISLKWYKVFDFIEFVYNFISKIDILKPYTIAFQEEVNKILEEEHAPYRMIEGYITPITDESEIETIKETFKKADKYQPVKEHLEKALIHLSNRTNPDYVNSIKEAISALESLANLMLNTSGKSLTKIHEKLCSQLKCPEPIKKLIKEYYDWASREEGIRHGNIKEKSTIGQDEAKLMLVQISGLINYLISKSSQIE